MFEYCSDPSVLDRLAWLSCYLTTATHFSFLKSFGTVLTLLAVTAPLALAFGFAAAAGARAPTPLISWPARIYMAMVRGIPDIVFFLFFVVALDQGLEWLKHLAVCPDLSQPVWVDGEFRVCQAAKIPLSTSSQTVHKLYGFGLAVLTFALVFGAFVGNVIQGAMNAVPRAQLETGEAYGMSQAQIFRRILVPQMWIYALPGLSNLWLILIKATPLLFLLGIQDVVYWARELGASRTGNNLYPHPDWRLWYFLFLLVFYLSFTRISEIVLARLAARLSHGQATRAGEAMRKEEFAA